LIKPRKKIYGPPKEKFLRLYGMNDISENARGCS